MLSFRSLNQAGKLKEISGGLTKLKALNKASILLCLVIALRATIVF